MYLPHGDRTHHPHHSTCRAILSSMYPYSPPVSKSKEVHRCKNGMKVSAEPIFAANVCLPLNIPSRHIKLMSIRLRLNGCWSFAGGSAVNEFVQWAINFVHNRILVDNRSSLMAQKRVRLPAGNNIRTGVCTLQTTACCTVGSNSLAADS